MKCPSCNQLASTFFETIFSLRRVSFSQAIRLQFKCRYCGMLLQHTGFGRETIMFLTASVGVVAILNHFRIPFPLGAHGLVGFAIVVFIGFVYCFWRYGQIEKVDAGEESAKKLDRKA